jgi:protein phosphatase
MKSYKQKNYEQALIETYLKFDELLRVDKVNQFLKNNNNERGESKLEISFTSFLQPEYGNINEVFINQETINEDTREKDTREIESVKLHPQNNNKMKIEPKNIPKENIVDLSKSSPNSNPSIGRSNILELLPNSKEVLAMDEYKIEISFKGSNENVNSNPNYDDLIAKDMGTTANILLIKNNNLYLANVGDSFAVLFKNGVATKLNQEHKTTLPSEYTRINKSGSRIINNRIEGRLNLTRALGIISYLLLGDLNFKRNPNLKFYEQAVTAYPEITKMKITKDFEFIIMACDGVWDCVDIQKLCEHISLQLKENIILSSIISDLFDQIISKTNNSIYFFIFSSCWN